MFDDTGSQDIFAAGNSLGHFLVVFVPGLPSTSLLRQQALCIKAVFIDRLVKTFRIAFFLEHCDVNSSIITSWTTLV